MKVYALTKKGNHDDNEDRILINNEIMSNGFQEIESNKLFVAVADGVGGNNAGAIASEFVCVRLKELNRISSEAIKNINLELIEASTKDNSLNKMATTLSAILIDDTHLCLVHIGNTRISIFQGKYIKQLTEDHTTVNWLVKTGQLSKKDAENHNRRNEIVACLGGGNESFVKMLELKENEKNLENTHKIVITSDGVHEYLTIDEMEELLNQANCDYKSICEQIIEKAVINGSEDDKSIVIIEK